MLTHSWPLLLTQLGVYAVFKLRIHYEDECLERRFGKAYLTYRRQVNELIPIPDVSETMSHSIEGIMFCNACGTVLQPRQAFCSKCGKQIVGRVSVGPVAPGTGREAPAIVCQDSQAFPLFGRQGIVDSGNTLDQVGPANLHVETAAQPITVSH